MLITSADYNPSSAVRSLGMKISIMTADGVKTFLTEDIISAEIFEGVDMGCERFCQEPLILRSETNTVCLSP